MSAIRKALGALQKNHSILVTSGSGMLADSGVVPLRGTAGLWKQYPGLKKQGITFEQMWNDSTFRDHPGLFWYLFGSLYNQYQEAEPHQGYADLLEILHALKGDDGWFIYHEGIDNLYERAGFPMDRVMQGKGNLFYWQCKPCKVLKRAGVHKFRVDHDQCSAKSVPFCNNCNRAMRPNVNLKDDMNWLE